MGSTQLSAKFDTIYLKLLQGSRPEIISPNEDANRFYLTLLDLDVNREFLEKQLLRLNKEQCFGVLKPMFNSLFSACLACARNPQYYQLTRSCHALETLCILTKCILSKNLSGWEVIEVFAGGAGESDRFFMSLTTLVDVYLQDDTIPAQNRHLALQLALVFMCSIQQLSPGAYFLRQDIYPSLIQFMKSPNTEQFAFEASLLLTILANFHRSDAPKLNPYLRRLKEVDQDIMRKICWAAEHALDISIKAYREIHNEETNSILKSAIGSVFASLRPAMATKPVNPPKEHLKDQPIETCVSLLTIYELLRANSNFPLVLLESMSQRQNLLFTSLSLSSYLLTHATSTSSPRSLAYANLCLNWLLLLSQSEEILGALVQPNPTSIPLCRQRQPLLPNPSLKRLPICALLDCCVLWLRHNHHVRLEVHSYINCIWICQQAMCYIAENHVRLEYEWKVFWSAILGLLGFLSDKLDSLYTTGGIENLVHEIIVLLDICLTESSALLPSPQALYEFIYELVHESQVLQKQLGLLQTLAIPISPKQKAWATKDLDEILSSILETIRFYEKKISAAGATTANQAMQIVAREIDRDGLHGVNESRRAPVPKRFNEVFGFARYGCIDSLALVP